MLMLREPFGELVREMNRLQSEFQRFVRRPGPAVVGGPLLNLWEDEQTVFAEFDLPGVNPTGIEVSVTEGNVLTVSGERQPVEIPGASWRRQERGAGTFSRTVTLPTLVDADKVTAKYAAGVVRIALPKAEAAKPRRIPVQLG
jgi:HSP20 family protein